ncbi:hypothetical protein IG631_05582 [Alternaria alternata]|nr:hypothetical protein IG631_05582 [Alternaria alternata]
MQVPVHGQGSLACGRSCPTALIRWCSLADITDTNKRSREGPPQTEPKEVVRRSACEWMVSKYKGEGTRAREYPPVPSLQRAQRSA